ncbi:hypothetical protein SARC_05796 [Sphaeroforma arctica JP610]|uniref:protein xylosyltransferase n=1 Tax=Sphaeroforma arctica JP610 TaxID=667725 RepID=A0A0L0FZC0_9EUKA|nr:hypothetical protein SARC_05796 [Sphaeroforma arctica JP610]KNC81906.1 hypothetical protein SARC_05796 [Sphaeroforma arctica JP610]|eukprot:XP_014155808.1 hypothetical protein SARC_05796 [Sphaeroforma arctica JP610]
MVVRSWDWCKWKQWMSLYIPRVPNWLIVTIVTVSLILTHMLGEHFTMMGETHRVSPKSIDAAVASGQFGRGAVLTASHADEVISDWDTAMERMSIKDTGSIKDDAFLTLLDSKLKHKLKESRRELGSKYTGGAQYDSMQKWVGKLERSLKERELRIRLSKDEVKSIKENKTIHKENRDMGDYEPTSFYQIYRHRNGGQTIEYPRAGTPENDVRIAYLFFIDTTDDFLGVQEALDILYETKHTFVIYITRRSHSSFLKLIREYYEDLDNVRVMRGRELAVKGTELSDPDKQVYEYAISVGGWDIAINLCGLSMPIKSPAEIAREIVTKKGVSFVSSFNVKDNLEGFLERNADTQIRCRNQECSQLENTPNNLPLYFGKRWVALSPDFTAYLVQYDDMADWSTFLSTSRNDVCLTQTVLRNSGFAWEMFDPMLDSAPSAMLFPGLVDNSDDNANTDNVANTEKKMLTTAKGLYSLQRETLNISGLGSPLFVRTIKPGHTLKHLIVGNLLVKQQSQ